MNYNSIARLATAGINFFSDEQGLFDCITQQGGVEMNKVETRAKIKGFVRSPKVREVDGEHIMATDKLGVFNNVVEIKNGYIVIIDGERYVVTEARPIRQTNVTVAYRPIMRRITIG